MIRTQKNYTQPGRKFGHILEIRVIGTTITDLLTGVEKNITDNTKFYILTPNPEIILMAQKDKKLKDALNGTDLAIPDGVGLKLAIPGINIIKGRELFSELINLAVKKNWKVFLLGGLGKEAEVASEKLQTSNPRLQIQSFSGPKLDRNAKPSSEVDKKLERDAIEKINKFAPQLLFVAFGNPKQEIWVHENYQKLNIGGAMAVGGAFRYAAGQSSLPPKWMSEIGLEWLYRLLTEPYRIGRIWNAVVVFPIKVFLSKF
jgi:N-acetylglucosaminyldiphosphoundecaprenol N-acetyl-beta-D-mannosaminyltransferase